MCGKRRGGLAILARPPTEATGRKTFLAQPKPLAVIHERLDCGGSPIPEHEHSAAEWIIGQGFRADSSETVDPTSEVCRLDRDENPHLGRDLDHDGSLQKLLQSVAKSGIWLPLRWMRILDPSPCSSSIKQSAGLVMIDGVTSTK
jgi:hypothetical protein